MYHARQTCLSALRDLPLRVNILLELPNSKRGKPRLDIQNNRIQVRVDQSNLSTLFGQNDAKTLLDALERLLST